MQKTASGVQKSMGKGIQGGTGFANVGMQIQDVAVQMQMGTSAATIFAQQGSQIASGFGPAGVAIGATVAVVGGLITAGQKSNEMFDEMIKNVGDLKKEADSITKTGSLSEITTQTIKLADASKELQKASDALSTMGGAFAPALGMALGGESPQERMNELALAASDLEFKRGQLAIASLQVSEQEVEVMRLKANGQTEAAEAMERELELKRKIAAINEQPFAEKTKQKLIKDETAKSDLEAQGIKREKFEKDQEKAAQEPQKAADELAQAQQRYADAQLERITDTETGQEKINRLTSEMNQLLDEAAKHSASSVESINAAPEAQRKENEILREKTKLQEEANKNEAANRQAMDDFRARRQKVKANEAEKIAQEQQDQADFMKEFRFNRAVLREKGEREKEQEQGMQSAFDGKRRKIRGYTGGTKSGEMLDGGTFSNFLNADNGKMLGGGTFNEFFHPSNKKGSAVKNASTTNTRVREGGQNKMESLQERSVAALEKLAAY